ncbi:MAG: hypothetical protein WA484_13795 [Solirubrobacteraceae bacterium]
MTVSSALADSVTIMSSFALQAWQGTRSVQLDELDLAHSAVGGAGPGRRYATRQLNHAYAVVIASQFQGFCRDLHSECADVVANAIHSAIASGSMNSTAIADIALTALTRNRQLDRGNASPSSVGADFKSFDLDIWDAAKQLDARTGIRSRRLDQLKHLAQRDRPPRLRLHAAPAGDTRGRYKAWSG